jgi:hypothetical protein
MVQDVELISVLGSSGGVIPYFIVQDTEFMYAPWFKTWSESMHNASRLGVNLCAMVQEKE